jgi:hypothetical protein
VPRPYSALGAASFAGMRAASTSKGVAGRLQCRRFARVVFPPPHGDIHVFRVQFNTYAAVRLFQIELARSRRSPRSKTATMIYEEGSTARSASSHGLTRMTVFPARRSVALKVATASSRAETLPMFVRSRPSRTRWTI